MSAAPPFDNRYNLREVAPAGAKACFVCYKPSCKVLISANKVDFFYVCLSHLKDVSFAHAVPCDAHTNLINDKAMAVVKIADVENEMLKLGYDWDFVNKIPGFGKKKEATSTADDKPADATEAQGKRDYKALEKELIQWRTLRDQLTTQIDTFEFKEYTLDKDIYRNRVRAYIQAKVNQRRQQEMQKPGFFPAAPTGAPN